MSTSGTGQLTPLSQVVNQGNLYLSGCKLSFTSTTVVTVSAGVCRDSTNQIDILLGSSLYNAADNGGATNNTVSAAAAVTLTTTVSGLGGIDTGTFANDTHYAVWAVGDSRGFLPGSVVFSLSYANPQLPAGYDCYRYLGSILSGTAVWVAFDQRGNGADRTMTYRTAIATDITNGSDAAWAAVDVTAGIPRASITGLFRVAFTPTAADDTVFLRCGDSATDAPQATMSGSVAAVVKTGNLECPVGATLASGIDYEVIGTATAISVQGYVDQL